MDFSRAWTTIQEMINGLIAALPNLVLGIMIFVIFFLIGRRARRFVTYLTDRQQKAKNLGLILGRLAQSTVVIMGLLIAMTILFPSFKLNDLIQLLGISSVAIGFAFHDIFQNFLAGILLLLTAPFKIGDQIQVEDYEGTVEDIQTRATTIRTYDGRRVVIPNTDLFTRSVTVNTALSRRRMDYTIAVDFGNDIEVVKSIILETLHTIEGIIHTPQPEVLVVSLSDDAITFHIHWWTSLLQHVHLLHLQDRVLTLLKKNLIEGGVTFPQRTQYVVLQTPVTSRDGIQQTVLPGKELLS